MQLTHQEDYQEADQLLAPRAEFLHAPLPREPRDIRDRTPARPRFFSTRPYEPSEQFDVWKTRISRLVDVGLPDGHDAAQGFAVEYMTCSMADVVLTSGQFAAQTFARVPRAAPIDYWWLYLGRSGEAWFESGDRELHAGPGAMFLVPLDKDFRGRITGYDGQIFALPRSAFAAVADELDHLHTTILSGGLIELLADYLRNLEARLHEMEADEFRHAGRATVAMIAACIQPAATRLEQAHGAIDSVLFERARLHIENHLGEFDLTPERVAQGLRISRSNLYRAFESVGGVARFIQRKRLQAAYADLIATGNAQVQEIAYRHGFRLASDFTRAFRREFGISPRDARERARR
jgi:AraC-like DNA-binding protein